MKRARTESEQTTSQTLESAAISIERDTKRSRFENDQTKDRHADSSGSFETSCATVDRGEGPNWRATLYIMEACIEVVERANSSVE